MQLHKEQVKAALHAALWLAAQGVPSFPCRENKKPACQNGFKDATSDAQRLRELWAEYPGSHIGMPTGSVSYYNILDIDPDNGGGEWWSKVHRFIPLTRTHRTRRGGLHVFFKHHLGIRNSASQIADGIDVRGEGGYIIWWPAMGSEVYHHNLLAEWPEWLLKELLPVVRNPKPLSATVHTSSSSTYYAQKALRRAVESVVSTPEGGRNNKLNTEAYSLGRFILSEELCAEQIAFEFSRAALAIGLPRAEIISTITSALRSRGV